MRVMGEMLAAGLDCYATLVDDQSIDAVLRVPRESGQPRYFDVQVKSAKAWSGLRGKVAELGNRKNMILVLYNSTDLSSLWIERRAIQTLFHSSGSKWGDIFLKSADVKKLARKYTLKRLMRLVGIMEG